MSEMKIDYWGDEDDEVLKYTSEDEAIEAQLEFMEDEPPPNNIAIYGFSKRRLTYEYFKGKIIVHVLDNLDEEFKCVDADPTEITPKMLEAERVFIEAVLSEYEVSSYVPVTSKIINVNEWIKEHRPDWLVAIKKDL